MLGSSVVRLCHRSLLVLRGPDTTSFLQGLITNDIRLLEDDVCLPALVLNTKGRIVDDILISRRESTVLVECSSSSRSDLKSILERYRMRKKVDIYAAEEPVGFCSTASKYTLRDPRLASFGFRVYGAETTEENMTLYTQHRLTTGLAEGKDELANLLPFQANADLLNMISLDKGCYIGQELTARTAHTGVIRRRILPFKADSSVDPAAKSVVDVNGKKVGQVITTLNNMGLVLLPVQMADAPLQIDNVHIRASIPSWMTSEILKSS